MSEIKRLAALLTVSEEDLAFLSLLEAEQVRFLTTSVDSAMHMQQSPLWSGLARATHLIPDRVNAKIADTFLGASATAQLSYHLPPKKALSISKHFSIPFLADVATNMEPSRAETLIHAFPQVKVRAVSLHLLAQQNYYAMGQFLDYLTAAQSLPILQDVRSDEAVLRIASYARRKENLAVLVAAMGNGRLLSLLQKTNELGMWDDVLPILAHLPAAVQARINALVEQLRA
jgi:hypothetical protein